LGLSTQKSDIAGTFGSSGADMKLLNSISYTHFVELIKIEDHVKRKYYELLILKTQPNVRELKRQIATLSYERLGFSENKEIALQQISQKIQPAKAHDAIKTHYFFEFLGISAREMIEESELEQALINHLQHFIIELGNGFCFEARQKRLLMGDEYFFVDLVFYHRILKCHVLIELKVDTFNPGHAAQLVTYLNYFKKNLMENSDNPPIGILLVTDKNTALVEYASANEKDRLFVSKYKLQLPSEKELKTFLENELRKEMK
jgi:predicted nuclease of restriction endonuclease-like (RecB) superfamily